MEHRQTLNWLRIASRVLVVSGICLFVAGHFVASTSVDTARLMGIIGMLVLLVGAALGVSGMLAQRAAEVLAFVRARMKK